MIAAALRQAIELHLPAYLERQRWYADKGRPIQSLTLADGMIAETPDTQILFALIGIEYPSGEQRQYFIPMTIHKVAVAELSTIAVHVEPASTIWIQDALFDPAFREYLVDAGRGCSLRTQFGEIEFEPWLLDDHPFTLTDKTNSNAAGVEQSNSSIAYDMEAMAKLYRRIEPGQNIEVDMNRYLASEAHLAAVPKLIGCITYHGTDGDIPLALIQQHAGEHRDCWSTMIDLLKSDIDAALDLVMQLGAITGQMHVALAAVPSDSPLAAERITTNDIESWKTTFLENANETRQLVESRASSLSNRSAVATSAFLARTHDWGEQQHGFDVLAGYQKTRVHGDYHLGQVLLTADRRLLIVDFEGEPQRSAAERAAKYSPLKDVAGMLRSLDYAAGFAAATLNPATDRSTNEQIEQWGSDARTRFQTSYRTAITPAPMIAPLDDATFALASSALEADKCLYEIRYELHSRPDWVWLPLEALDREN